MIYNSRNSSFNELLIRIARCLSTIKVFKSQVSKCSKAAKDGKPEIKNESFRVSYEGFYELRQVIFCYNPPIRNVFSSAESVRFLYPKI